MSIYAANNRMGRASDATVVANESYGANDIGRILYETQVNDQAIFEAIIASDLAEIQGLREGTLLESEIEALNENSVKGFFQRMKERLMAFWAKIKGVFKSAIAKIAYFLTGDASKFIKVFDKEYKKEKFVESKAKIEGVKIYGISNLKKYPTTSDFEDKIKAQKGGDKVDKAKVIAAELGSYVEKDEVTPADFKKALAEFLLGKGENGFTVDASNVDEFIKLARNELTGGKTAIKTLKQLEADVDRGLKDLKDKLTKAEKEALGKDASKEDKEKSGNVIANIAALVSCYETVTSNVCSGMIGACKANTKTAYSVLNKILHACKKGAPVSESAAVAVEDEVDAALDVDPAEIPAEDQAAMDEIIDSVEVADAE